jgi:cell division protein YceG involved in septum cleavage
MTGLPKTPINNPTISSIKAVINPTKTEYYYYLHGKN